MSRVGSRVFDWEASGQGRARRVHIREGDLATGQTVRLATLDPGHELFEVAVTADRIMWVDTWRTGTGNCNGAVPCCAGQGQPLHWQVVELAAGSAARSPIASGIDLRTAYQGQCADVNPPELAADDGRVAYTLEATAQGAPFGNRIVVRSLSDGAVIRSVTMKGFVPWLGLSGPALAYRETLGTNLDGRSVQDARLMLATADDRAPELVDDHVFSAAITGDRLVWGRTDATDASIWTTSVSTRVPTHVAGPSGTAFKAQGENGSWWVSFGDTHAAWVASGTTGGDQSAIPFLWRLDQPSASLVALPTEIDFLSVSDGWLIWHDVSGPNVHGVQLSILPR